MRKLFKLGHADFFRTVAAGRDLLADGGTGGLAGDGVGGFFMETGKSVGKSDFVYRQITITARNFKIVVINAGVQIL